MKKEKGFTLVEMLVSIAIIAAISGASLVYFRGGNRNWALIRATQAFTQDIRRASNMALSSPKIICNSVEYSPQGYGIYFNAAASTYALFAALESDLNVPTTGVPTANCSYNSSEKYVIIETITMEAGTKVLSLNTEGSPSGNNNPAYISIVFVPPDPTVKFSNGAISLVAVLSLLDGTQTKQITINKKGNINTN